MSVIEVLYLMAAGILKLFCTKRNSSLKRNEVSMKTLDHNSTDQDVRDELKDLRKDQVMLKSYFLKIDRSLEGIMKRIQKLESKSIVLSDLN